VTSPFVYISAWNDSGGGFLHRLFDGHRRIRCYPFEVQLGTGLASDGLADWFHPKYRWPKFPVDATSEAIFSAIINDELWDAVGGSPSSKFKDFRIDLDVPEWRRRFADRLERPLSVGPVVRSYLDTFFDAWRDRRRHDGETLTLGHCPVLVIDWDRILHDDPSAKMINVVRSPFTGFVDMRRRHPTLEPTLYGRKWSLISTLAFVAASKTPERFRITAFSDLIEDRAGTMRHLANWLGIENDASLLTPSWNGRPLLEPGPFGGVPRIGVEHELENLTQLEPQTIEILANSTTAARALFDIPKP
jgi:hypothetical protein